MQVVGAGDLVDTAVPTVGMSLHDETSNPQHEDLLATSQLAQQGKAGELLSTDGLLQARRHGDLVLRQRLEFLCRMPVGVDRCFGAG